jgi:hypothetical protein
MIKHRRNRLVCTVNYSKKMTLAATIPEDKRMSKIKRKKRKDMLK